MRVKLSKDGNVYMIRDVFDAERKLVTCQYAVADFDALTLRWTDCREGVAFTEIRPVVKSEPTQ